MTFARALPWIYLVGGVTGLAASFALAVEKYATLRDPTYVPTCSLNPIVSCGSVMDSPQAEVLGFPNPLLGVAAFAVVITVGVVLLSGYSAPDWFRWGMLAGTTLGVLFVHWLAVASLYSIEALCPYCMVVWVATIPVFWYTLLHALGRVRLPATARRVVGAAARYHSTVLAAWFVVIAAAILQAFWDYWRTLL